MQLMSTNERVRLIEPLPELDLYAGHTGVIRSAWLYPNEAYEVEFDGEESDHQQQLRLLLLQHQIAPA